MTTKIPVCLEIGPHGTGAFIPSCPGCWVFARTPERALVKEGVAVREWFEWLEKHGERVLATEDFEMEIAEMLRVNHNPVKAGKPEPIFWSEVVPINRKEIARTLRLMKYSREDLLKLVSGLNNKCLDWAPHTKPRTIRNCLRHIAYVEPWYITRLNVDLHCTYPRDVFRMLDCTHNTVVDYLENFPREKMRGVFQPSEDLSPMCNLWTARKVLRRLVDHEMLHMRYIEKVLQMHRENA